MINIHYEILFLGKEKNKTMKFIDELIELEEIILSEMPQTWKDKCSLLSVVPSAKSSDMRHRVTTVEARSLKGGWP